MGIIHLKTHRLVKRHAGSPGNGCEDGRGSGRRGSGHHFDLSTKGLPVKPAGAAHTKAGSTPPGSCCPRPPSPGFNLETAERDFVVVAGPAAAGKTTLCHYLSGPIPTMISARLTG